MGKDIRCENRDQQDNCNARDRQPVSLMSCSRIPWKNSRARSSNGRGKRKSTHSKERKLFEIRLAALNGPQSTLFMKISSRTVHANGIRQHYLEAGDGPPVVLLHGFPETSYAWRYQIPELAKKYHVIAPDLRGYGETEKPSSGYDKRTMAMDLRELMRALNLPRIALVGHDRGARVATRFAKDHWEVLDRLVVMDNVPTRIVGRELDAVKAKGYWFFLFHLVPNLPEALLTGREDIWLRYYFSDWC
jgi:hypothetical protein